MITDGRTKKELAFRYWELLSEDKLDEALDMLHDFGTWWLLRSRELIPLTEMKAYVRKVHTNAPARFYLHSAIEEGDHVALEVEGIAHLPDGRLWNNRFTFLVTMWGDKILQCKEYADTQLTRSRGIQPTPFPSAADRAAVIGTGES